MTTLDELRGLPVLAGLSEDALGRLVAEGESVAVEPGDPLWVEGRPADSWWLLVAGAVELSRTTAGERTVVGRLDAPGRWAGGFRAWDEHGTYLASARALAPSRFLRVPAETLRAVVAAQPLALHLLEGFSHTARGIEASARQRESLVALGRLSAGLAHELNNPAAAAARSASGLAEVCDTLLGSLGRLAGAGLTAEQFAALDGLRTALPVDGPATGALDVAAREDRLSAWLEEHDVAREWVVGPTLVAGGADVGWCDAVARAVPVQALDPALEWVASTVAARSLLDQVTEATSRMSALVSAAKSYTQMDRAAVQRTDVTEGLDSTLTMLGHRLGDVVVTRSYAADLPVIDAYAGELNQVWTNLVDNAVDAMDGAGRLTVTATHEEDVVRVEVSDTGPGMAPEVAARVFEPFFTTKDVGKGTGLGLDIARRIVVDRHGGSIEVTSSPAGTTFVVRLPVGR